MMNNSTPYAGERIVLMTQHATSTSVAWEFQEILGATVSEYPLDTGLLDTMMRDSATLLEKARRKCEWGISHWDCDYALASASSFDAEPFNASMPFPQEILYFIDRKRNFHLHLRRFYTLTSYQCETVDSVEALERCAGEMQFPSHALVLRPDSWKLGEPFFQGITQRKDLVYYYQQARKLSSHGLVRVETDLRAHVNPTRLAEMGLLARKLARRLTTCCPVCQAPGWGLVSKDQHLSRNSNRQLFQQAENETHGCVLCEHTQTCLHTNYRTRYCRGRSSVRQRQFHMAK